MAMDVKNTARTNGAGKIRKVAIITEENGKQDGEHSNIGWTKKEGRRGFVLNADAKQFLECMSWTEEVVVTTSRKVQGLHATTNVYSI